MRSPGLRARLLWLLLPVAVGCQPATAGPGAPPSAPGPATSAPAATTATAATAAAAPSATASAAPAANGFAPMPTAEPAAPPEPPAPGPLKTTDQTVGKGRAARDGDTLVVHYVGTLQDGSVFDSSRTRGTPFEFKLGKGMVIKGWDQGMVGMKVGGLRRLTIPPELAYGERGVPPRIPPGSTLLFDVELLAIR